MNITRAKRLMLTELFIFLTLAGTVALLFQPLMAVINKNITIVRERLITQAESILNRPIRYGSMDPSIIGTVEIRTLTVGDKTSPLVASERLFIEYSMWDLVRGKGIGAVRTLILENPEFSYDRDRDGDIRRLFSGGQTGDFELPSECVVVVRGGSITLSRGKTAFSAGGIALEGKIDEDHITLNGVWHKNLSTNQTVTMDGSVSGSFSRDFTRGNAALSIDSIEAEGFTVDRIGFGLSFFEDRVVFERDDDGFPLTLSAVYFHDSGDFSADFTADRFTPDSMIHLRGPAEQYAPLLGLELSGGADFSLTKHGGARAEEPDDESIAYRFSLSGSGAAETSPVQSFAAEGAGDASSVRFRRCILYAKTGFVRYAGDVRFSPTHVRGDVFFSDFSFTGADAVNGTVLFGRNGEHISFDSTSLRFGDTALASLSGTLAPEAGKSVHTLTFTRYRETEAPALNGGAARFESRGSFQLRPFSLEGTAALTGFYADDILALIRPFAALPEGGAPAKRTRLNAGIRYQADSGGVRYEDGFFRAEHDSGTLISVLVNGSGNRLTLSEGIVRRNGTSLSFGLDADYHDPDNLGFQCRIGFLNYQYDFDAVLENKSVFTLRSNHDFSASVRKEGRRWSGSVAGRGIPLPYRNRSVFLSLAADFSYNSPASWNFVLNQFDIRESRGLFALSVRGGARENGMNLERIFYTDRAGPLEGSAAAVWNRDFSVIDASFFLSGENETETLAGDVFYEPGNLEFYTRVNGFKGARVAAAAAGLRASGEVNGGLSGSGYYLVNLDLTSLTGTLGNNQIALSGLALLDPERLTLSSITFTSGAVQTDIPYVSLDRSAGRLETEAMIAGTVNEQDVGALVSLGVNFNPMTSWFDAGVLDSALSGVLDVRYAYVNRRETPEPLSFVFTRTPIEEADAAEGRRPAVYRVSGGFREMLYAEFQEERPGKGIFSVALGNPSPVQGFITGVLDGTTVDALATEVFVDLPELYAITPITKVVNFSGGAITGSTRVSGSIFDPEFSGTAWASGVTLTVPQYVAEEIGPGSGLITLDGNGFTFGPVDASCGEGHGVVTAASLGFTRWRFNMGMAILVDKNIPFEFDLLGIMAKGSARGSLNLLMEEGALLTITGDLEAEDSELAVDQAEIERSMSGENRDPDSAEIVADVRITTGRKVEFLWPNSATPLLRAYGEARNGVRLTADTRVPQFSMDGEVTLRGGELYHLQRSFYIREGVLQFNGNSPDFDPLISARAEVRDNNDDGPVTITMIMENVPLSELEYTMPRYQSSPSLSQVEIYSLLGQAPPSGELVTTSQNLNPLISSTSEMLIQTVVFRRVEQVIRNTLGLDMFSFRTQILQNALFEAVRNREPEEQPATIGNYLDNTTVFVGKYVGSELFFHGLVSFRYDQYKETRGGLRIEPEIGFDLRTPLFDVRWNFQPEFRDSLLERFRETYFVDGQSVSLLWRWSL